jgi:cytochrome c oxidase subunit I
VEAATVTVLHPRAASIPEIVVEPRTAERRVGLLFAGSGIALVAAMGVLGLIMRLTQATVIDLPPAWFYRLMTLHGAGMLTGTLLAMMGALWFVLRSTVALSLARVLTSYSLILVGALCVVVATLVGGFGTGWTFLTPLPFYPAGQWQLWATTVFLVGILLVGAGFFVFCADVLAKTTSTYGGLERTLGIRYLRGLADEAPPPSAIAATVVAIDGLLASAVGATMVAGLIGRAYDRHVGFDVLVAKNLTYFFGHEVANLILYLAAGAIYVLVPRYAGRSYPTTKPFVAGWLASLVFLVTAYSHHLYMDFVQPQWAQIVSSISSYAALIPVAVITIYSMTMLVWGSAYRWTLASTFFYLGFAGWAIGGTGAVIDSIIPVNFRFHNTDWVVAHFHTYLMMTVVFWALAFLAHLLERDAAQTSSRGARASAVALMLVGGYGLTGTWFVAGVLGIPRRYAIQPPGTSGYSLAGSIFALLFALGFLVLLREFGLLASVAWRQRHYELVAGTDSWTGSRYRTLHRRAARPDLPLPALGKAGVPLRTPAQLAAGVAATVVSLWAFFPQVVNASETTTRYHHLDHAGQFLLGALVGLVAGSLPAVSRRLGERSSLGLAAVIAAPTVTMLLMVPRFYSPLESHPAYHALYHIGIAALGLATGVGATRLGLVAGRLAFLLSVGMMVMFAAAMTGAG